jgi:hypothetical protein
LLWFDETRKDELYHVESDPGEERNLIDGQPALAGQLRTKLIAWLTSARESYLRGDYPGYQQQGRFIATLSGAHRRNPHNRSQIRKASGRY